jgi:energy-coupling factor transporter transmembrane protein EcfT
MANKKSNGKGISQLLTLALIVFVILKLAGVGVVASWSWLWVLSPLWIQLVIAAVIYIGWEIIKALIQND